MKLLCACLFVAAAAKEMPVAELKPEYINVQAPEIIGNASGSNFVFLQKFPLGGVSLFFHTEVLVCPRDGFSTGDQKFLDGKIASIGDAGFLQIDESWWTTKTANCVVLGYRDASCSKECCSVLHTVEQQHYQLKERRAVIGNADVNKKEVFVYGTGAFDGNIAWHYTCDKPRWSNRGKCSAWHYACDKSRWTIWSGRQYNLLKNNCNTFTSTMLSCVYGLSAKKPHLGLSDMVRVTDHCPSSTTEVVV